VGDTFALPDLSPLDFVAARAKVRELKLGWRLVFEGTATDNGVRASEPAAGTQVKRGDTVKIFVKGAAPLATVPNVVGRSCEEAAGLVVESGLYPAYPAGRSGKVVSQTPPADAPPTLRWNDELKITCGG
jgi:beta-lactam-binding protein with PASTA domain